MSRLYQATFSFVCTTLIATYRYFTLFRVISLYTLCINKSDYNIITRNVEHKTFASQPCATVLLVAADILLQIKPFQPWLSYNILNCEMVLAFLHALCNISLSNIG